MKSERIKFIISLIILVLVIGVIVYYLWPKQGAQEENSLLSFKIVSQDLSEEEKADYLNKFQAAKTSLEQNPDNFTLWLGLGMLKKDVGDYEGAEKVWIHVGEIRPKNSISFGNLADLYANFLKDYNKAISAYQTAIANSAGEAGNARFYRNFFEFYLYYLNDKVAAESILLEGIERNPASSELPILLAGFYRDEGNKQKAIEYFQKALELDPQDDLVKAELKKLK